MGDRIVVMNNGVVQQTDTPLALYSQPANLFVAGFLGSPPMNFVNGTLKQERDSLVFSEIHGGVTVHPCGAWCLALGLGFGFALAAWHGIAEAAPDHWPTALLVDAMFASIGVTIVVVSYACLGTYLRPIRPEPHPGRR